MEVDKGGVGILNYRRRKTKKTKKKAVPGSMYSRTHLSHRITIRKIYNPYSPSHFFLYINSDGLFSLPTFLRFPLPRPLRPLLHLEPSVPPDKRIVPRLGLRLEPLSFGVRFFAYWWRWTDLNGSEGVGVLHGCEDLGGLALMMLALLLALFLVLVSLLGGLLGILLGCQASELGFCCEGMVDYGLGFFWLFLVVWYCTVE